MLTIHRSKGLEFPVVYLPFLWEPGYLKEGTPVFFHDPEAGDVSTLDVTLEGAGYNRHREQFVAEQRGEDLRLAYVALTRARHQAVVWWAGSYDSRDSPLGRLLFARDEHGEVSPTGARVPDDRAVAGRLGNLAEPTHGRISLERAGGSGEARWSPPQRAPAELSACAFDRQLDLRWRRTSYSDITAASHESWVTSEPEEPLIEDEPSAPVAVGVGAGVGEPVPLAGMPSGVEVGTFVHSVLEATDFAASDLTAELTRTVAGVQARRAVEIGDPADVVAGLAAALQTPLGPGLDELRLTDVAVTDRLDELGFELPLAGGQRPSGAFGLERIAGVLRDRLPDGDPMRAYAERLDDAGPASERARLPDRQPGPGRAAGRAAGRGRAGGARRASRAGGAAGAGRSRGARRPSISRRGLQDQLAGGARSSARRRPLQPEADR